MDVAIMDCDDRGPCYFDNIPEEIISKILRWLPVKDLCNAILVCKHWRTLGEDPVLWKKYLLEVNYGTKLLPETLKFKRFSKLENLLIRGFDPYNEDQMRFDPSLVVNSSIRKLELRLTFIDRNVSDFSSLVRCLSSLTLIFCLMTQVNKTDAKPIMASDHCFTRGYNVQDQLFLGTGGHPNSSWDN